MTALYVPPTDESDHKKQNQSIQNIAGITSTNTTNIATNTANIATNTTNIASNTSAITALQALGYWTNTRLAKTAAYAVLNADKGSTIALGGSAFYTLTFNAASGYDANFAVVVLNEDTGRGKTIACNGLSSFILWPGQSCTIFNQNNVWKINPASQRWKIPNNTTVYVDAINGNDANDGLAAGAGNAVKTMAQAIRTNIKDFFDLSGISVFPTALVTVQLADNGSAGVANTNAYSLAHIAFTPVGNEGRCTILIQGNASTPSNTIISDNSGANIGAYGAVNIELRNLQIGQTGAATPVANACIEAADGANIRCEGGVIFGTSSVMQLSASNGGSIIFDASFSIVGGGQYFAYAANGGRLNFGAQACTISNTPAYSNQFAAAFEQGQIVTAGTVWTGSATGTRYFARNLSLIFTNGTTLPGSVAGSNDATSFVG